MTGFAIIAQMDESKWDDVKGEIYHFPDRYKSILSVGCNIIYYNGRMKDNTYEYQRLSKDPHYFGVGIVGESRSDPESDRQNWFCEILEYKEFSKAIPFKVDGEYIEEIPPSRRRNYWRDGVREISQNVYEKILQMAETKPATVVLPKDTGEFESYGKTEGTKKVRYSTYYERNPFNRERALEIHGLSCMACGFNFEEAYGERGKGFIHVHHLEPISETGSTIVDPETDLSVLCPNCHAMVHRRKDKTLSMKQLKELLEGKK